MKTSFTAVTFSWDFRRVGTVHVHLLLFFTIGFFRQSEWFDGMMAVTKNTFQLTFLVFLACFVYWTEAETVTLYNHTSQYGKYATFFFTDSNPMATNFHFFDYLQEILYCSMYEDVQMFRKNGGMQLVPWMCMEAVWFSMMTLIVWGREWRCSPIIGNIWRTWTHWVSTMPSSPFGLVDPKVKFLFFQSITT